MEILTYYKNLFENFLKSLGFEKIFTFYIMEPDFISARLFFALNKEDYVIEFYKNFFDFFTLYQFSEISLDLSKQIDFESSLIYVDNVNFFNPSIFFNIPSSLYYHDSFPKGKFIINENTYLRAINIATFFYIDSFDKEGLDINQYITLYFKYLNKNILLENPKINNFVQKFVNLYNKLKSKNIKIILNVDKNLNNSIDLSITFLTKKEDERKHEIIMSIRFLFAIYFDELN